jgi:hypothetical protein
MALCRSGMASKRFVRIGSSSRHQTAPAADTLRIDVGIRLADASAGKPADEAARDRTCNGTNWTAWFPELQWGIAAIDKQAFGAPLPSGMRASFRKSASS